MTESEDEDNWNKEQVKKILDSEPNDEQANIFSGTVTINKSLYKILKVMFRVKGVVQVGWACPHICDGWLRSPRPLFLGRRKINQKAAKVAPIISKIPPMMQSIAIPAIKKLNPDLTDKHIDQIKNGLPPSDEEYETEYPYFLYPYLISENDTIANLKGRIFLDQDTQNAASSLLSATLTQARRAAGLYFSKDTTDPNDDFLLQKNVYFKTGALINGKIKEMKLDAPDPQMFTAIQLLVSSNQQETSQVNFAETNKQADSRKTATAIKAATQQASQLSGVQVTLFSVALKEQFTYECDIIKSRVITGLIKVNPIVAPLYARSWTVKPSGDVDVIEKQQLIQAMMTAWPVIQNTGAAIPFLTDLLEKEFPDSAAKYVAAMKAQIQQQQAQQQSKMGQGIQLAHQAGQGILELSKHPEWFSETGRIHALPLVEAAGQKYEEMQQQQKGQQ